MTEYKMAQQAHPREHQRGPQKTIDHQDDRQGQKRVATKLKQRREKWVNDPQPRSRAQKRVTFTTLGERVAIELRKLVLKKEHLMQHDANQM